jgi:2-iminobutanoate/2-iminopropanoate deaminase
MLYLSGQAGVDPSTGRLIEGDVEAQTQRAFDNLELVLLDADLSMNDVIKCNVYLTDMANFQAMNSAYQKRFTRPYPARTTIAAAALPLGALVEIELVARRG